MAETEKDIRYKVIKAMWEIGRINSLSDCFNYVPKSVIARDIKIWTQKLNKAVYDPHLLNDDHLVRLAGLIEISFVDVLKILAIKNVKRKGSTNRSPAKS